MNQNRLPLLLLLGCMLFSLMRSMAQPGTLDLSFNPGTGTNSGSVTYVMVQQPDGKVIIGGDFTSYNGSTVGKIARINTDGSLDASFAAGTGFNGTLRGLLLQPDGKIIAGGDFTSFNGTSINRLARINPDGSLDATFNVGSGINSTVVGLALQPDGKLLVGGIFSSYNGTTRNKFLRVNSDGSLDNTFNVGTGLNNSINVIYVEPSGKIVCGGDFVSYNGSSRSRLMRVNPDGSIDNTFDVGSGFNNNNYAIARQPDGKVLIGGYFTTYNGSAATGIIRLNTDGSRDASFDAGTLNSGLQAILLQSDGKIVIGGTFTTINGTSSNYLARLNADGSRDATFNVGTGASADVRRVVQRTDGKFVVAGQFATYNGTARRGVFRVLGDATISVGAVPASSNAGSSISIPFTVTGTLTAANVFTAQLSDASGSFTNATTLGTLTGSGPGTITGSLPCSASGSGYLVRVSSSEASNSGTSSTFAIVPVSATVNPVGNQSLCAGSSSAAVHFTGTASSYQWTNSTTAIGLAGSGTGDIPSFTATNSSGSVRSATLTVTPVTGGCSGTPASFTIAVYPTPVATSFSYTGTPYCSATGTVTPFFSGFTGGTFSAAPAGLSINATTGVVDLAASSAGNYTVSYTASNGACTVQATAVIGIRPALTTVTGTRSFCGGSTTTPIQFSNAPGLTFPWTNTNTDIGLPASGSGDIPAFLAVNSSGVNAQADIRAVVSGGTGCAGTVVAFRITVKPEPTVNAVADQVVCLGSNTAPVTFGGFATVFTWTNTNTSVGINATGSGNLPALHPTAAGSATFQVTPVASGCSGTARSFTITVAPSAGSISYPQAAYCPVVALATPSQTGAPGGSWSASPAGLSLNGSGVVNLAASLAGDYVVSYSVGIGGGCQGAAQTNLRIKPVVTVNSLPNQVYCSGVATAPVVFNGTAATYSWTANNPAIGVSATGTGTSLPSFTTVNAGPTAQGSYIRVTPVADANSCAGSSACFRILVNYCGPLAQSGGTGGDAATQRMALAQQFEAGPNPARSTVVLRYTGSDAGLFTVQLVSQYGEPIGRVFTMSGNTYTLDLSNVTPGTYSLRVTQVKTGVTFNKQVIKL